MHAPLVKYPFDDCSNLLGCCKGWSRGGLVCSLVQLYASRVVGLTMQENFRCSNDSVVLATIRRSCNKSRNKSSNVEHGAVNERTGTRCGFTFRARAFRALLAGHLRMPSLAAGCWTYVASTTIQYVGKTQERFRGDQTEPLRSGRKYTPSKNKCRPRGTKLYASKTGTILESTACTV